MTKELARTIGKKEAIKSVTVGLIIAYLIMSGLAGLKWFFNFDYKLNLLVATIIIYASGYIYGQFAGLSILIKGRNYLLIGVFYGLLILITATFISSWVGFFQQGIKNLGSNDNPFVDYIYRPIILVTFFGLIPVLLVGFWFGASIKSKGEKFEKSIHDQT